jgi:hypothetical protein
VSDAVWNDALTDGGMRVDQSTEADGVPDGVYRTPPEVARMWRCKPETVVAFIRSGELAAVNLAKRSAKRPRWRISPEAIRAFEQARAVASGQEPVRRHRKSAGVIQFF